MRYAKPALTPDQQAELLIRRGMRGDHARMVERLRMVSYYRLSGYWHPFRQTEERFADGTDFERIWRRYVFDRRLRLLVMDAIERIEVAIRSQLAFQHALRYNAFAYAEIPASLPNLAAERRPEFLGKMRSERSRSHEAFVRQIPNNRVFAVLTICRYCLRRTAPQSLWAGRLKALLADHPDVPIRDMGFPENWMESPIWDGTNHAGIASG